MSVFTDDLLHLGNTKFFPSSGLPLAFRAFIHAALRVAGRGAPVLVLLSALLLSLPAARAQSTYSWTGTTNGNLSGTTTNWDPNGTPGASDVLTWNATSYTNAPTANANMSVGELLFGSGNTGGVTFGAGANTITLGGVGGDGIQMDSGSGAVNTGSAKFAIGADQNWTNNSANALTIGGTITNTANTAPYRITIGGTGNTVLTGIISNGGATGTTGITKNGTGTLTLNATNTFTGGVTLNSGTLAYGNQAGMGTGALTINGGTLQNLAGFNPSNNINLNGDVTFAGAGSVNFGGTVTLGNNVTITTQVTSGNPRFNGGVSGGYNLTVKPTGNTSFIFNGNNSMTGAVVLGGENTTGGTVTLGSSGRFLSASSITVRPGVTFDINAPPGNVIGDTIPVTVSGGTLKLTAGNNAAYTETLGTLTLSGGQSSVFANVGTNSTAVLTLGNATTPGFARSTGATVMFGVTNGASMTGTVALPNATLTNGILGGWAAWGGNTANLTGGPVTVSGGNVTAFTAFSLNYTTNSTVGAGGWASTDNVLIDTTTPAAARTVTLGANQSVNSVTMRTRAAPTLDLGGNTLQVESGGIYFTYNASGVRGTIANGTLTAGSGTAPAELFIWGGAQLYNSHNSINATITDNNGQAVSLVKGGNAGGGVQLGDSSNSYSGGTYINDGQLVITADGQLGATTGAVYFGSKQAANNDLSSSLTIQADATLSSSRNLVALAGSNVLINTYNQSSPYTATVAGKVTGAGGFIKDGLIATNSRAVPMGPTAGTVVLTNANNDWGGGTSVNAGTLQVGDGSTSAGSIPNNDVNLVNVGTLLRFATPSGDAISLSSTVSGNGSLEKTGAGTLTLGGTNSFTSGVAIKAGTLSISADSALGAAYDGTLTGAVVTTRGTGYSNNAVTFTAPPSGVTATGNYTVASGQLLTVTMSNNGTGYVAPPTGTLNGAGSSGTIQAYVKGLITLDGGTLQTTASLTSNRAVYLTSNGGGLDISGAANSSTFSGVLNGNGALAKSGNGTLILTGANTYTGTTTISGGTLQIGAGGTAGTFSTANLTNDGTLVLNRSDTVTQGAGFASIIDGSGNLTQAGTGTLILTGANTYSGTTAITTGTIQIGNAGSSGTLGSGAVSISSGALLTMNRTDEALNIANNISGAGNITQAGSGTSTLSGNNTNTGAVTASSGTLKFSGANALSTTTSLLNASGGTLSLADGTARALTMGGNLSLSTGALVFDIGATSDSLTLTGGGLATMSGTNTIRLNFLEALSADASWTLLSAASGLDGTWALDPASTGVTQSGFNFTLSSNATTLTLTAAQSTSSYYWKGALSGNWSTISGNLTNWTSDSAGSTTRSGLPESTSDIVFAATGAGNLTTVLGQNFTVKSLTITDNSGVSIGAGNTLTLNSTSSQAILVSADTGTATINAGLAGSSAGLTKSGASTLVLGGNNSFGGGVTLSAGTLRLDHANALGTSGTITLGGGTIQYGTGVSIDLSSRFSTAGSQVYAIDTNGNTVTFATNLSSSGGALTKNGTETLILSANNTYTGTTTLNTGTIQIGAGGTSGSFGAGAVTLGDGTVLVFNRSDSYSVSNTLSIASGAAVEILAEGSGTPTLSGGDIAFTGSPTLTLGGNGTGVISSTISTAGSAGSVVKAGTGTWTLSAANAYTGNTTINAGALRITDASALGDAGDGTTVANGAALELSGGITVSGEALSITGSGISGGGALRSVSGNNTYNATITLAGAATISSDAGLLTLNNPSGNAITSANQTLTFGGAGNTLVGGNITLGTGGVTMSGSGLVALNGTLSWTGTTTINSGTLQFGNGADNFLAVSPSRPTIVNNSVFALSFAQTTPRTFSSNVSGNGSFEINAGVWNHAITISGNNSYSGGTVLNAGHILINSDSRLGATTGAVTFNGSDTSGMLSVNDSITLNASRQLIALSTSGVKLNTWQGSSSGYIVTVEGQITGSGNFTKYGRIMSTPGDNGTLAGTAILTNANNNWGGSTTVDGGILQIGDGSTTNGSIPDRLITLNDRTTVRFANPNAATFNSNITGNGSFEKTGAGLLTLGGTNTFLNGVTIGAGTLSISSDNALGAAYDGSVSQIVVTNLGSGYTSNSVTIGAPPSGVTATGDYTTSYVLSANQVRDVTVLTGGSGYVSAPTVTFNGAGTGATAQAYVKGLITLDGGTLQTTASLTSNRAVFLTGNGGGLDISGAANTTTFSGILNGNGSFTKSGAGTLVLSGNNTFNGTKNINAGTIQISHANALGTSGNISFGGGTLQYGTGITTDLSSHLKNSASAILIDTNNENIAFASAIDSTNSGGLTKNGTGTLTLSGANSYTGGTTLNTGTLVIGNTAAAGSGTLTQTSGSSLLKIDTTGTVANAMSVYNVQASQNATLSGAITVNNANFEVDAGDTLTISNTVNGTGGVTKNGDGTLVLSGSNNYAGATTVNAGTLQANNANALGANNTVQVNGGSLLVTADGAINGKDITLASTANGTAGLVFSGNYSGNIGTLTLSADSIIDLGDNSVVAHFAAIANLNNYILKVYNWTGTTLWNGGNGNNTDQIYFGSGVSGNLDRISFYSDFGSGFLGTGFQIMSGGFANEVIPVPEAETWVAGVLLILGSAIWLWGRRRGGIPAGCSSEPESKENLG